MCDYSLQHAKTRPAVVGEKLVVTSFGSGTRGFSPVGEQGTHTAVCLVPGTEIVFDSPPKTGQPWWYKTLAGIMTTFAATEYKVAIFRQINQNEPYRHHDAIEMPDGKVVLLTGLDEGQMATVLQLPAAPKTKEEEKEQTRLEIVG